MKTKLSLLVSTALLSIALAPAFAQDTSPTPAPSATPAGPGGGHHERFGGGGMHQGLQDMTPEEREKLKAAREKAMQDPKVQSAVENLKTAGEAFRAARKQALLAADSSLGPILDKIDAAIKQNAPGGQAGGPKPGGPNAERGGRMMEQALNSLTPEEREKVKAASEKIKDNPDVVAARQKMAEAEKQFQSVLHDALIAADPSIEPLLQKMEKARQEHQAHAAGGQQPPAKP